MLWDRVKEDYTGAWRVEKVYGKQSPRKLGPQICITPLGVLLRTVKRRVDKARKVSPSLPKKYEALGGLIFVIVGYS